MKWINKRIYCYIAILLYCFLIPTFFVLGFSVNANSLININTAGLEELDSLPGIGPSKAQAIIDYRQANGDFANIEEIMNVYGIGQGTFDDMKNLITVGEAEEDGELDEQLEEEDADTTDYNGLNGIEAEEIQKKSDELEQDNYSIYKNKILINEIMFNPVGIDNDFNEWIEIYNNSNDNIYLTNWLLRDNISEFKFDFKRIPAKGFAVVRRGESGLNLNNFGGEKLELFDSQGKLVDEIEYNDEIPEGQSYNWCRQNGSRYEPWSQQSGEWQWLAEQSVNNINNCPSLSLELFAYFEVVQNGKEILLDASESYDKNGEIVSYLWEFEYEVIFPARNASRSDAGGNNVQQKVFTTNEPQISVELLEEKDINVILKIINNEGEVGEFSQKITINNQQLTINNEKPAITEDSEKSTEDTEKKEKKSDKTKKDKKIANTEDSEKSTEDSEKLLGTQKNYLVSLDKIRGLTKGTMVRVEGQVLVEPGTLGATIFYIGNPGAGVQVYCYKKDFPGLVVGDLVRVNGEISEYYNETRIKIKNKNDIYVIESGEMPEAIDIGGLGGIGGLGKDGLEGLEGSLIKISGEVTSMKYDYFYLDDGSGELKVTVKQTTGMDIKELGLEIGEQVAVTGILSQTKSGYRLLPRYRSDIFKGVEVVKGVQGVKGIKDDKNTLLNYLIAVVVAGIVVMGIVIWRRK